MKFDITKYFILFHTTILVKGNKRSLLQSIYNKNFNIIPNELIEILILCKKITIKEIYKKYGHGNHKTIKEYFEFLLHNNYGYLYGSPEGMIKEARSPNWNLWSYPFKFSNAIIDYNINLDQIIRKKIIELGNIGCSYLQIRFFNDITEDDLSDLIEYINNSYSFMGTLIVCDYSIVNKKNIEKLISKNTVINEFLLFNSPQDEVHENLELRYNIIYSTRNFTSLMCGNISPYYFTNNIQLYTESLHHNTCLNRKIAIDTEGNIKNCPSMKESYGNIRDTTLEEAINKPGFKKYWNITKDEITKCKDCEFRHVCTDCRAYLENPEDIYSAPLKCGYNPYTCEWEEWSTNPLKQKAIDYYGMRGILNKE